MHKEYKNVWIEKGLLNSALITVFSHQCRSRVTLLHISSTCDELIHEQKWSIPRRFLISETDSWKMRLVWEADCMWEQLVLIQMRVYIHQPLSDMCIKGSKCAVLLSLLIFESPYLFWVFTCTVWAFKCWYLSVETASSRHVVHLNSILSRFWNQQCGDPQNFVEMSLINYQSASCSSRWRWAILSGWHWPFN